MLNEQLLAELRRIIPEKVSIDRDTLLKHSGNQFYTANYLPDAVCFPESEDDIIKITQFCVSHEIPIIPYGGGTSVEGHLAAIKGGISINLKQMNKVIEFEPDDGYVVVEPGISYNVLNEYLEPYGYHFPVEAGWGASIGGMVSTNASGAGAVDSGSMTKNVLSCNVVVYQDNDLARVIRTGTKSSKTSAGYNLTSIFIGAEGTLGIITQVTLKIRKNFECTNSLCCQFENIEQAIKFVIEMKSIVHFRRVELLDKLQTTACLKYSNINYLEDDKFTILIELAGNKLAIEEESSIILSYLKNKSAINIKHFSDPSESKRLWMMRKNACPAAIDYIGSNKKAIATDISVPISKLATCINACYKQMNLKGIRAPLVSHIGDGNFHFTILVNPDDTVEMQNAKEFSSILVEEALRYGGTCTGEHGVGIGKIQYVEKEHGDSLFLMRNIKNSFDPKNIFNPGKVFNLINTPCIENKPSNISLGMFSNF